MRRGFHVDSARLALWVLLVTSLTAGRPSTAAVAVAGQSAGGPAELAALFDAWRTFQAPPLRDGVPDYSEATMASQHAELGRYRARLEGLATAGWPLADRVDWHLVRAEMNGFEFDHRVRRPWANDPAFYMTIYAAQSDVPAHEGPVIHGWVDLWTYEYPLAADDAAEMATAIGTIPALLRQARTNLIGGGQDLWRMGVGAIRQQSADLTALGRRVAATAPELDAAIASATRATDAFAAWVSGQLAAKTGLSGVGRDAYTWTLQNVHYLPYAWDEVLTLMYRELWRSHAALRLEENRNRDRPRLIRFESGEEYDTALNDAVSEYMQFLEEEEIVSIRPYMDAALRARIGRFSSPTRPDGLRGFFSEVQYRDGIVMRTHGYHWFDLARMDREPHASVIRSTPLLYNLWDARSEGMATGVEEMLMHAGLFDGRPRARELIWILLAQRAARAIGGLMMHANEWTMQQAVDFASAWTPRGWLPADGATVWGEQHLYLRQPVYGVSYVIGKIEIEKLLAERAVQLGDGFTVRRFFDELDATGVIPLSLARWELTGEGGEIAALTGSD